MPKIVSNSRFSVLIRAKMPDNRLRARPSNNRAKQRIAAEDLLKELSTEQLREYYEAFCLYDHDGSGTIDTDELAIVMTAMGQNVNEQEVKRLLALVDDDGSGELDFPEFVNLMAHHLNKPVTVEEVKNAFLVFDPTNRGYVTASELKVILTTRGDKMTPEEADEMIAAADLDGDGLIDYAEFSAALCSDRR